MAVLAVSLLGVAALGAPVRTPAPRTRDLFSHSISALSRMEVAAASTGARDSNGRPLFPVEELVLRYELTNLGRADQLVGIHQTPLSGSSADTNNFFGFCPDVFHTGIIADDVGEFDEFITVRAGETVKREINFGSTVASTQTSGIVELELDFEFRMYPTRGGAATPLATVSARTNRISVSVDQAPGVIIPDGDRRYFEPAVSRRDVSAGTSSVQLSTSGHVGVPYWNFVCADDDSMHGYTYSDGSKAPCSGLAQYGYCSASAVQAACPVSCDACAEAQQNWAMPWDAKSYEISSECTASEQAKLTAADELKDQFCANILYCLEKKTPECEGSVKKWFGGTSADATEWETLRQGFARMCSATNYKYNCRPTTNCRMTFAYQGTTYNNVEQAAVPADVRDGFIDKCLTSGCSYSGTTAWVYGSRIAPREVNLCPITTWLQGDHQNANIEDTRSFRSKAALIVHELSHFNDIAGTNDMTYNNNLMLATAETDPWHHLHNAANWDNLSEDDDHGSHAWADFDDSDPFSCTENVNFITGAGYTQQSVCGSVGDVIASCQAECDRIGCTAFFYQEHPNSAGCELSPSNGYQICGFTTASEFGTTKHSWHRDGSQVCLKN